MTRTDGEHAVEEVARELRLERLLDGAVELALVHVEHGGKLLVRLGGEQTHKRRLLRAHAARTRAVQRLRVHLRLRHVHRLPLLPRALRSTRRAQAQCTLRDNTLSLSLSLVPHTRARTPEPNGICPQVVRIG